MENIHVSSITHPDLTMSSSLGESDSFSSSPWWAHWISTAVLSLIFIIGLPLNGATVLIFCRRKKLRHLVNFVLLLDCLSHIVLCLLGIPLHLVAEWSGSSSFSTLPTTGSLSGVANLQQVIGNFVNLYSTFLTVSIAILRYRRLCWKKKDKFSTVNALKWSVTSGILAIGVTFVQSYVVMIPERGSTIAVIYLGKISLILLAVATVFFCYIRVSQRVWANTANQEKTMDPVKLKKSRSVHLKATIHSCVQIVLVITTVTPHLYLQALEMLAASSADPHLQVWSGSGSAVGERGISPSSGNNFEHIAEPMLSASSHHQQQLFNFQQHVYRNQPMSNQDQLVESGVGVASASAADWMDNTLSFSRHHDPHHESLSGNEFPNANTVAEDVLRTSFEIINSTSGSAAGAIGDSYFVDHGELKRERGLPVSSISEATAERFTSLFGGSQLARLIAITINYALLVLGTPCAYIASCHRFREQFTSILFSHVGNSPQNSTCQHHGNPNGHHHHSSPGNKTHHKERYHYHHRSTTGGTQDACFSSPLTRADRTSSTALHHQSSLISKASRNGHANGGIFRDSVSISANTRSSFSHSFKSRSSVRKSSICGSSMKRRSSSTGVSINGGVCGGKGLLGVAVAADSVFMESDSAMILEQDGSSSTGNLKPSPSPVGGDEVSGRSSLDELVRKNPACHLPLTAITTITGNSSALHTYLQNYADYQCATDLGQLV